MVDNQNKYNKQRLKIVLDGIPAVMLSIFLPKKRNRIILNSHFNESFDFNSKFLFLYFIKNGYDAWFVINNDENRKLLINQYGNHFVETKTFKGKIFALRAKLWFVSAFELPVGGIFLKLQRKIIHLTHGSLIKNVGLLEKDISFVKRIYYLLFIRTNLSYSIATSDFFVPSTAGYTGLPEKKILISGFPRNDALFETSFEKTESLKNSDFKVLYAPTWRKEDNVHLFPFDNVNFDELEAFLAENNITIYIRLHPYNEISIDKEILKPHIKLYPTSECKEIMDMLCYFNGLITDYSSILYDFMLLNRPLMFFAYDFDEYKAKIGFAVDYDTITPGYKPKNFEELKSDLLDMKEKDSFKEHREKICSLCNTYKDGNSERLLKILKSKNIKIEASK